VSRAGEYARDDDADDIREVHLNQSEGEGTGLRHHLRAFRGVHKKYLKFYVALYELARETHRLCVSLLQRMTFDHTTLRLS
jgi:transposase-like protein